MAGCRHRRAELATLSAGPGRGLQKTTLEKFEDWVGLRDLQYLTNQERIQSLKGVGLSHCTFLKDFLMAGPRSQLLERNPKVRYG